MRYSDLAQHTLGGLDWLDAEPGLVLLSAGVAEGSKPSESIVTSATTVGQIRPFGSVAVASPADGPRKPELVLCGAISAHAVVKWALGATLQSANNSNSSSALTGNWGQDLLLTAHPAGPRRARKCPTQQDGEVTEARTCPHARTRARQFTCILYP